MVKGKGFKVAMALAAVAVVGAVAIAQDAAKPKVVIDGSTTVGPIADAYAEHFKAQYDVTVKKTGSGDGIAALIDGRCDIASASRFMKPEEFKKAVEKGIMPVAHTIALDAVCMVVHPSNPVKGLTITQIHDIYSGKIKNWKELGGADKPIVMISRDTSSGTYETFMHFVMGKDKLAEGVEYVNANPQAKARVESTEGAIGYVGLGFIDEKVKALEVNDVPANTKTIRDGNYPMARPLFLFTNGFPDAKKSPHIYAICVFHFSEAGQKLIDAKGFIPLTNY